MICKVNNLLKTILLLLYFVTTILGDCIIRYTNNPLNKPQLSKKIGRRIIKTSNNNDYTILPDNQEIIASCDIKFKKPDRYENYNEINIRCDRNYLHVNANGYKNGYGSDIYLECASLKWNLYDLLEPFVWCPSYLASYILARPQGGELYKYRNLAGICYDTSNMALSSIYYTMAPRHYIDLHPMALTISNLTLMEEIKYVKDTFALKSVNSTNYDNKQFEHWIKLANYQYNSTIQNPILYDEVYNEFGGLLDFQWWPSLRLGNWHLYEEALAKHIEKESMAYDILAGISGVVKAPIKEICENNYTMRNLIDNVNRKIPLYIWNYLHPSFSIAESQGEKDIVIIGFNSPFNEFYEESNVVFCQDICHEIDWLKNVRSTFRYSTMGIVFCCSVDEVRSSKRLDNFPQYMIKPIEETTPMPLETTTQEYHRDDKNNEDDENPEIMDNNEDDNDNEDDENLESNEDDANEIDY